MRGLIGSFTRLIDFTMLLMGRSLSLSSPDWLSYNQSIIFQLLLYPYDIFQNHKVLMFCCSSSSSQHVCCFCKTSQPVLSFSQTDRQISRFVLIGFCLQNQSINSKIFRNQSIGFPTVVHTILFSDLFEFSFAFAFFSLLPKVSWIWVT